MLKLMKLVLSLAVIMILPASLLFAGESKQECIAKFDIDSINVSNSIILDNPKINNLTMLADYYSCKACSRNDISVCEKLSGENGAQFCRDSFNNTQGFFMKLLFSRGVLQPPTRDMLETCSKTTGFDLPACKRYLEAFAKSDATICDTPPFVSDRASCQAFITLNESLVTEKEMRDTIFYLKAIRDSSIDQCKKISNENFRRNCGAYVTGDEKKCNECSGYDKFRDLYCTEASK